jgi:hypothetical protein
MSNAESIKEYECKYRESLIDYFTLHAKLINATNPVERSEYENSLKKQLKKVYEIGIVLNSLKNIT